MSSAVGDVLSFGTDMLSGDLTLSLAPVVEGRSKKGFLEVGLGGGSSNGEASAGDRLLGETARLRKGLLEPKFRVRPGLARSSGC